MDILNVHITFSIFDTDTVKYMRDLGLHAPMHAVRPRAASPVGLAVSMAPCRPGSIRHEANYAGRRGKNPLACPMFLKYMLQTGPLIGYGVRRFFSIYVKGLFLSAKLRSYLAIRGSRFFFFFL
jgi:hypothetical protein